MSGRIEIDAEFVEGLADLDGFSHLILLYRPAPGQRGSAHRRRLFLDDRPHGIFATRSPARPNPIGRSTVRLVAITGSTIEIKDVDMVDGTPLLDIKPYVPAFDERHDVRVGRVRRIASAGCRRHEPTTRFR